MFEQHFRVCVQIKSADFRDERANYVQWGYYDGKNIRLAEIDSPLVIKW